MRAARLLPASQHESDRQLETAPADLLRAQSRHDQAGIPLGRAAPQRTATTRHCSHQRWTCCPSSARCPSSSPCTWTAVTTWARPAPNSSPANYAARWRAKAIRHPSRPRNAGHGAVRRLAQRVPQTPDLRGTPSPRPRLLDLTGQRDQHRATADTPQLDQTPLGHLIPTTTVTYEQRSLLSRFAVNRTFSARSRLRRPPALSR